jgi:hypothetical protein
MAYGPVFGSHAALLQKRTVGRPGSGPPAGAAAHAKALQLASDQRSAMANAVA